MSESLA